MDQRAEKLGLIEKWVEEGTEVPFFDIKWAVEEIKALELKVSELEKANAELKDAAIKISSSNHALRHALTMWLAVRGSNSEEFFMATKTLAQQTTKALND